MKKRLCIGVQKMTKDWGIILDQLGVWYEEVDYSRALADNYVVIILNDRPDSEQTNLLNLFVKGGNSVLEINGIHTFVSSKNTTTSKVKGLVNTSENQAFHHIPFVDLYSSVDLHQNSSLFDGMIHFENAGKGHIAFLGMNPAQLMQSTGYRRKRFYSEDRAFPDEIVSKVSKKQVSDLLNTVLKELHFRQDVPYMQKWSSPEKNPVFGFRIDSDFGDQESVDQLYQVLKNNEISATWFLHVQAHEDWLEHFHSYENQEMALHGYEHGTSGSIPKTQENIRMGKYLLEEAGFNLNGFCAPYGIWNKALFRSLKAFYFNYSSEFTFAHDGLPIQHHDADMPLQIPVHPICTGSMNRKHYTPEQMRSYFLETLNRKTGRFEPVFFYHHPLQPGLDVIESLFSEVNEQKLTKMTFSQFADFWRARKDAHFEAVYDDNSLKLKADDHYDGFFQVSTDHDHFYLMKSHSGESWITDMIKFEYSNCYLPTADDAEYMNRKDLQMIKTSLLDWKNRIRL